MQWATGALESAEVISAPFGERVLSAHDNFPEGAWGRGDLGEQNSLCVGDSGADKFLPDRQGLIFGDGPAAPRDRIPISDCSSIDASDFPTRTFSVMVPENNTGS